METKELEKQLRELFPNGHPGFVELCLMEMKLHSEKNHDYAKGGNPLGNFYRVSEMLRLWGFDIPPHVVALIYMLKQLDAAGYMLGQGYEGQVEGIRERLGDVSVYSKLAKILFGEHKKEEENSRDYLNYWDGKVWRSIIG